MINLKMTERTFTAVADWAERIQMMTQENSLIDAQDIVHDVFGMLRDDEHFLPRLWITTSTTSRDTAHSASSIYPLPTLEVRELPS